MLGKNKNAKSTILVCLIGAVVLMSRVGGWMENLIVCEKPVVKG